jgi:hypothetical protein
LKKPVSYKGKNGLWINGSGTDYANLNAEEQQSVQDQITTMIEVKYSFINHNSSDLAKYIPTDGKNPFSDKLVIVDEAHNFVSRIVNALNRKKPDLPACQMYRLMMEATNCKIVFLSGTPMINYPHEISVMFNMLRGYMTTWSCKTGLPADMIRQKFPDADLIVKDVKVKDTVHITHSPQGFIRADSSNPDVVRTNYDSTTFEARLTAFFEGNLTKKQFTAFPDNRDEFNELFVGEGTLKDKFKLECRLVGLASYFPDLSRLMPRLSPPIPVYVPMSTLQFNAYTVARDKESKSESKPSSSEFTGNYRSESRQISNTTYPIKRPVTTVKFSDEGTEDLDIELIKSSQSFYAELDKSDYCDNIKNYSPKFDRMVTNITDIKKKSKLHLVYSQFITIEGLNSFARVLAHRGFTQLELVKVGHGWTINMPKKPSPMYIIYSADKEEKKELYRNIFNKNWDAVPESIRVQIEESKLDISVFMITSAGSEGISLKNVQYVHIMEPYWNPVRTDQVIGRARRICSHNSLPEQDRFVEVYLYLSVLPKNIEKTKLPPTIQKDSGKDGTTDEYLYALSQKKRSLSEEILKCIRRASIDCSLYNKDCLKFNTTDQSISYNQDIHLDETSEQEVALTKGKSLKIGYKDKEDKMIIFHYYPEGDEGDGMYKLYRDAKMNVWVGYYRPEDKKTFDTKKVLKPMKDL